MILDTCKRNEWSYDTPNIAGKVHNVLKRFGYTRGTVQDYVRTIVDLLETQKENHQSKSRPNEPEPLLKVSS